MFGKSIERGTEDARRATDASSAYLSAVNLNRPFAWACIAETRIRSGVSP